MTDPENGFTASYEGYTITNTSGAAIPDLWVKIGGFTGAVQLAPNEDGVIHVGPLAAGASTQVYFYLNANPATTTTAEQPYTISLYRTDPSLGIAALCTTPTGASGLSFIGVEDEIKANANKVTTIVSGPNPATLGGIMTLTVSGETGTIGTDPRFGSIFAASAAGAANWPANAYQLVANQIEFWIGMTCPAAGGVPASSPTNTFSQTLYIQNGPITSAANSCYRVIYTFVATAVGTAPTNIQPVNYISSGTQIKDTGSYPATLPQLPTVANTTSLSKSVSPTNLPTGGTATYTVTVRNSSTISATLDGLTDILPAGATYIPGSSRYNGSVISNPHVSGQTLTWTGLFTVAPGATATLTYQVTYPNTVGSYTNNVTGHVGATQIDTTISTTDNVPATATLTVGSADMSVSKSATPNPVLAGNRVTYTIIAANNGNMAASNAVMSDSLPTGSTFVSITGATNGWSCTTPTVGTNGTITCTNPSVAAGSSTTFTVIVDVASSTANSTTIANTATISSTSLDSNSANNSSTAVTTVNTAADLRLTKTATGSFTVGQLGTYTLTVTNDGPSDAAGPITISDALPAGLSFVSGGGNGWACSTNARSVVTCTNSGGIAHGVSSTMLLTVNIGAAAAPSVRNSATVSSPTSDTTTSNNTGSNTADVTPVADLVVGKTIDTMTPGIGDQIIYTITVYNNGPNSADDTQVTDVLPEGLTFVSADSGGTYSSDTRTVTWNLGSVPVNPQTPLLLHVTATVNTTDSVTNIVTATTTTDESNTSNNTGTVATNAPTTDVSVTKATSSATPNYGSAVTFTITVQNNGPGTATNVVVSDALPAGLSFVSATDGGSENGAGLVTWTIPSLAANTEAILAVTATVTSSSPITNNVQITSADQSDPDLANNQGSVSITPQAADVSVIKSHTDSFVAGRNGTYTLTVGNSGPSAATGLQITDMLPEGLTFVSATGTGWTCTAATQTVTCTNPGPLAKDATSTINLMVAIDAAAPSSITNSASVSSSLPDLNSGNNTGTDTATITSVADLSLRKTHSGSFYVGSQGSYSFTVTNAGPSVAPGPVTVVDTLPTGMTFVAGGNASWSCSAAGQVVTCTNPNPLAVNATSSFDLTVDVGAVEDIYVTNTATVSSAATDPTPANNTSIDPTSVVPVGDLSITKTMDNFNPNVGDTVIYTLVALNDGPSDAFGVEITDELPQGVTFISADADGTYWSDNHTVTWSISPLANGASVTLHVTVRIDTATSVTNTARIFGNEVLSDPDDSNNESSISTSDQTADLSVTKTASTPTPNYGGTVTYTITVQNTGPNTATNVTVTDALPAGLSFVSATNGGSENGAGLVTWTIPRIAANTNAVFTVTATVNSLTPVDNTASITSVDQPDPNPGNESGTATITPQAADLSLNKTHTGNFTSGQPGTYTLTLSNSGPSAATGPITLSDPLPAGLTFQSISAPAGWMCTTPAVGANGTVSCVNAGPLSVNVDAIFSLTVNVGAAAEPGVTNTATVAAGLPDQNTSNNSASDPTTVIASADFAITKTHIGNLTVGQTGRYTLAVTNNGPSAAAGPITVSDILPTGLSFVSGTGTGWSCGAAANVVTCTHPEPLVNGTTSSIILTVSVGAAAAPGVTNTATVSSPTGDPDPENNDASDPATVVPVADLVVGKTVDTPNPTVGQPIIYTIRATNNGPSDATSVVMRDTLPAGVTFQSLAAPTGWTCTTPAVGATGTVTCTIGMLPNGASTQFDISVMVNSSTSMTNTATITGAEQDSNPANNADSITTPAQAADLVVNKTVNNATPNYGSMVTYTVTVHNNGPSIATNVVVSDLLPAGLSFVSATPGGSYNNVTGAWTVGTLANTATATLTIVATVNSTDAIQNTAGITSVDQSDPDLTNNQGSATVTAQAADMSLSKTANPNPAVVGEPVVYTIVVANNGPSTATNVAMTDPLPAGLTFQSHTAPIGWTCTTPAIGANGTVSCSIGSMVNGATATIVIIAIPTSVGTGTTTNTATVNASQTDLSLSNNSATASTPTDITLTRFTAIRQGATIVVTWATALEVGTSGFHLYRSSDGDRSRAVRITGQLFPARGSSTEGETYTFTDTNIARDVRYTYWLEEVTIRGQSSEFGPVTAQYRTHLPLISH